MDETAAARQEELNQLLQTAARVAVALDRVNGTIVGVPHYSVIEARAHELGRQLSRTIQAGHLGAMASHATRPVKCPECGTHCEVVPRRRRLSSIDGPLTFEEPACHCPRCRRGFFPGRTGPRSSAGSSCATAPDAAGGFSPLREALGFDARALTPLLVRRLTYAGVEARSFRRAAIVMEQVAGPPVSAKTIERVVHDVGREPAQRRGADPKTDDALARRPESPPVLAVVECDGGRIRTREPGHGPGVRRTAEGWRETKNARLIRARRTLSPEDPEPEPPACFRDPGHVAEIAETEALSVASASPPPGSRQQASEAPEMGLVSPADWHPERLVRTVLSSMAESKDFGDQMAREAQRRRFAEADARAFLGDGLPWNWSIWKRHFRDSTPVLDFIHVLSYLFLAAKGVREVAEDAWGQYLAWMRGAWRGEVGQVLEELRAWQLKWGEPADNAPESDPRQVLSQTITYRENNQERMRYPDYRQQGLPVTTAWMESLVKEVNYRVKGTEMFWDHPDGAEAILQVRAAARSDDERLAKHLAERPGCPFTRRPQSPRLPREKIKG
jgi:hypothetical protein